MKTLVIYYSATGHTKRIAEEIAENLGADLFEVAPAQLYSEDDLDWSNPDSRCSREYEEKSLRDIELASVEVPGWDSYERVILCYPIWYGIAAWPISSFVKKIDFGGRTVVPVCTSHTSGLGESDLSLHGEATGGEWKEGVRFFQDAGADKIKEFCAGL